jgi:alanine racemase
MPGNHDTVLEVDLSALAHNYALLRSKLRSSTRFLGVVKAYAYGSESLAVARKLESLGADYLAVAFTEEGVLLRQQGIQLPILVLHPQPSGLSDLITHCLEPNLYSRQIFCSFQEVAQGAGQKNYPVHLEFNTGLNRLGFRENDLEWIAAQLRDATPYSVRSVFSHLAASDDLKQHAFTKQQIDRFAEIASKADDILAAAPFKHLLNTSGVLNFPEAQWDMVRCGIGLYGYANDPAKDPDFKPVARLRTRISQLHRLQPGEWVGYNMGYQTSDHRVTATLPVGHADGIGRHYGHGKGKVYINGIPAPILGNVCMDMTMVDVSEIDCQEGDEVIFFGPEHPAEVQAGAAGTISYELLAGISQRVQRRILHP